MDYIQCMIKKKNDCIISWIPEKFAKKGNYLKLKNGDWDNGWVVYKVFSGLKLDERIVLDRRNGYKTQRKASDM